MRILHVVETLEVGGLEKVVINLILQQIQDGHECTVTCLFNKGVLSAELEKRGIPVSCCNKKSGLDITAVRYLSQAIRVFSADVVHSHNITSNYYSALALLGRPGIPLVNTRHGIGTPTRRMVWLFGLSLLRTRWIVGVCDQAAIMLKEMYPYFQNKICTIPNGIVLEQHPPRTEAHHRQLLRDLDLPEDSLLVSVVARLNAVKNHALLIDALALSTKEVPQMRLAIIGDGPTRTALEDQTRRLALEDKVLFLGDHRDVPELLAGMDLFVLPSLQEGHSISLLEACASALPIIATDVGGNAEIVRDGINGLLTQSGDTEALADKMILLLQNKPMREEFGRNARIWAETEGSVQITAQRYNKLYADAK